MPINSIDKVTGTNNQVSVPSEAGAKDPVAITKNASRYQHGGFDKLNELSDSQGLANDVRAARANYLKGSTEAVKALAEFAATDPGVLLLKDVVKLFDRPRPVILRKLFGPGIPHWGIVVCKNASNKGRDLALTREGFRLDRGGDLNFDKVKVGDLEREGFRPEDIANGVREVLGLLKNQKDPRTALGERLVERRDLGGYI